ncbi:hypothetical protein RGQ15_21485 [Paracoccus sp. MBLB3053]|uniref:DUF4280 domain-containing protein n=1 Tax=Paracoccus aurantius TaxID=3073814 RepID=A0ABU2HYI7_9RHOB|nr:hypothetical protein [Paracoccus sp. MBLB3053]MDS9470129.1 hypothetical protein [Paracoccus sp. MBLB3053]
MPGQLLHMGAIVTCSHGGQAMPTTTNPRVTVSGQPVVPLPAVWSVAGCALPPPPAANGPCVTASFIMGTTRVTSLGTPLAIFTGISICTPTGTPLIASFAQPRVIAT